MNSIRRQGVIAAAAVAVAVPTVTAFAYVGNAVHPAVVSAELPAAARADGAPTQDGWQGITGQDGQGTSPNGQGGTGRRTRPYGGGSGSQGSQGGSGNQWGEPPAPGQDSQSEQGGGTANQVSSAPGVLLIDGELAGSGGKTVGTSAGTGMVLSADGYALTNYHVVQGTSSLKVTVADTGKSYTATVVGADQTHDVALLRLKDASGLTPVSIDDQAATVGEKVTAIGNGGGQDKLFTVSGSVQQLDDDITVSAEGTSAAHQLQGLIRTNAQVVPGYSGGPLYDDAGKVIGINTAASSGGSPEGFAIPIQQAMGIVDTIEKGQSNGPVRVGPRPALGIEIQASQRPGTSSSPWGRRGSGSQGSSGSQQSTGTAGALITGVSSGGAAAKAGLQTGATITALDGTPITDSDALQVAVLGHKVGDTVQVTWTDTSGASHTTEVTLAASPIN